MPGRRRHSRAPVRLAAVPRLPQTSKGRALATHEPRLAARHSRLKSKLIDGSDFIGRQEDLEALSAGGVGALFIGLNPHDAFPRSVARAIPRRSTAREH